jgi:hypothetical protein
MEPREMNLGLNNSPSNPSEIELVVSLRLLLDDALRRAADTTTLGLHVSVLLLDGACERALAVACDRCRITIKKTDGLADLHSKLVPQLSGWKQDCWTAVRQLHEARNLVQHHGVRPDAAHLPAWSSAVRTYVRSLVQASFGLDVTEATLADAIYDRELRDMFLGAEKAMMAGDAAEAFQFALSTFNSAEERWSRERAAAIGAEPSASPTWPQFQATGPPSPTLGLTRISAFTDNSSEWIWLQGTRKASNQGVPIRAEDARRAMTFVWGWVIRWQSFSQGYDPTRVERWRSAFRIPACVGTRRPHLLEHVELKTDFHPVLARDIGLAPPPGPDRKNTCTLHLQLCDVADPQEPWLDMFNLLARNSELLKPISIHADQGGRISVRNCPLPDAPAMVNEVKQVVGLVGPELETSQRKAAIEKENLDSVADSFRLQLADLVVDGNQPAIKSTRAFKPSDWFDISSDQTDEQRREEVWVEFVPATGVEGEHLWYQAIRDALREAELSRLDSRGLNPWVVASEATPTQVRTALITAERVKDFETSWFLMSV